MKVFWGTVSTRPVHSETMPSVNVPITGTQPVACAGVNVMAPMVTAGSVVPIAPTSWRKPVPSRVTVCAPCASQIPSGLTAVKEGGGATWRLIISSDLQLAGGGFVTPTAKSPGSRSALAITNVIEVHSE